MERDVSYLKRTNITNMVELNGSTFIRENHEMYNGYFHINDWERTIDIFNEEKLCIKGYTKSPAMEKVYLSEQMWGIALEYENGEWFWFHIQVFMIQWIDSMLDKK